MNLTYVPAKESDIQFEKFLNICFFRLLLHTTSFLFIH